MRCHVGVLVVVVVAAVVGVYVVVRFSIRITSITIDYCRVVFSFLGSGRSFFGFWLMGRENAMVL